MENTLIQKVIAVSVLVVLVLGAFVPIIANVGVTTETTTETRTYATNSLEGYSDAITASSRGNVASITTYRADSDGTANVSGDWVYYPIEALSILGGKVNAAGTIYANVSNSWVATDLSVQTLPYTAMYTGGTEITFTADPDNAAIADIALTEEGSTVSAVLLPYDVIYYVNTTLTYGTNSIHSLVLTDTVGDIALSSGTSYAFTANAGGDWLQIPAHILRDSTQTYKVLDGSYIYVPDGASTYAQYTVDGTSISITGMTLTFTQDTSITSATVYNMTATVTDIDQPGVVIEHVVETISTSAIPNVKQIAIAIDQCYYVVTSSGALYVKGYNGYGELGLGDTNNRSDWVLSVPSGVDKVIVPKVIKDVYRHVVYYITTNGDLYAAGGGEKYAFGDNTTTDKSTWTQVASGVEDAYITYGGSFYKTTGDVLYATGQKFGAGSSGGNYTTWTQVATNVDHLVPGAGEFNYYITNSNVLYHSGANFHGVAGDGTTDVHNSWVQVATDVAEVCSQDNSNTNYTCAMYVSTSGALYGAGDGTQGTFGDGQATSYTTWTQLVSSGVEKVAIGVYNSAIGSYYIDSDGILYIAGSGNAMGHNSTYTSWTQVATDVADVSITYGGSVYEDVSGALYSIGAFGYTGLYDNTNTLSTWTEILSDQNGWINVGIITSKLVYRGYIDSDSNAYFAAGNPNYGVSRTWTLASASVANVLYTNPTETETVSDLRGTVSGNTFTADPDGDYLYVPIEDAVDYAYYVSVGSTVYAPNTLGDALAAHTVPDVTGIDPAVTITLTQVAGYNNQIYSVTATTTDTDIVGWAIPYIVTYTGPVDTHYAYNYVGIAGYGFLYASDGPYLKVPYPMTATNGFSYSIDYLDGFYYLDTNGELVSDTAEGAESIGSATKALITVGAADDGVCSIELSNGTDGGYMVIPYAYTGGTNEVSSYIITYTPVRGNVSGNTFTAAADGDYIALYSENLGNETYYIGTGQVYYVVEGFDTVMETVEAPTGITAVYGAVSFVPTGDNEDVYTVSGSTLSDYGVVVPYTATYEETTTVVTETFPMVSIVIVAIIVLVLLGVISLIPNFRGGL